MLFLLHRTWGAFELTRICWTLKPNTEDSQLIGHFTIKKTSIATCVASSQRLAVTTEQTIADD